MNRYGAEMIRQVLQPDHASAAPAHPGFIETPRRRQRKNASVKDNFCVLPA